MRYRLLDPSGSVLEEGEGVAEMAGGALVVSPAFGAVLRIAPADLVEVSEPEPYAVRLVLADGPALELRQLGAMRTQLLAELSDARAADVTDAYLLDGVGRPEEFPGWAGESAARVLLYDDALVVLPDAGAAEKVPYPFVLGVTTDPSGYRLAVEVAGRDPLVLHRFGARTTELVDLLTARHRAAAGRTSAFLGALLPGLGALGLRTVAGCLRDGLAGARADLDRVDPSVWPALVAATTRPDRAASPRLLESLGATWIGFKQTVSVERPAEGTRPWRDPAISPDLGDHGAPGSAFGSGLAGVYGAGFVAGGPPTAGFDAPFATVGPVLAYQVLGFGAGFGGAGFGGSGFGNQHAMVPRADVTRGRATPAHTDLEALSANGPAPSVLAFMLCLTPGGRLLYEVLNEGDHATYVYRAPDTDTVAALNRALDLLGFRVEGIYADASSAGSRYRKAAQRLPALRLLREAYVDRVAHTDDWAGRLRQVAGSD